MQVRIVRRSSWSRASRRVLALTALLLALVALGGCSNDEDRASEAAGSGQTLQDIAPLDNDVAAATFQVQPSVEQVAVTGTDPDTALALFGSDGTAVMHGTTDEQGSLIFRQVPPADGYRVATASSEGRTASEPLDVVSVADSTPEQSFYESQTLDEGFGYIQTRDGTTLSASVFLPGPIEDGPYPTVVEYSGYAASKPGTNLIEQRWDELSGSLPEGITQEQVCALLPAVCNAPDQPSSLIANALGYAVVAVNMRGTACSGGAYDFFEPLQVLDGYDVIETVAAQDWVDGPVGMVGLSYPGISQLFVASSNPPSLAAITPLSVYDDTVRGVLAPGGIFNEGFALEWAENVLEDAQPYGMGWEQERVYDGDETCAQNQLLRGQNVDVVQKAKDHPFYEPAIADPLNPSLFVDRIDVPVFLSGSFQDEQTGGRFPHLINRFKNAPITRVSMWNGAHADGYAPHNLVEWKTFLDFYVAQELTPRSVAFDLFAPVIMSEVFGVEISLPPQRMFDEYPDFAAKLAAYEAEDPIWITLESGIGDPDLPGAPIGSTTITSSTWPLEGTSASTWYLGRDGVLLQQEPAEDGGASRFTVDEDLAQLTTLAEGEDDNEFRVDVTYDWRQEPDGSAAVFVSPPLEEDLVLIGSASADLWIRSSAPEADLGVTLSEVRPDGAETYIQSGTLRASHRATTEGASELLPLHSHAEQDAEPVPDEEFVEARVEVFPFAHVVRAGSRLRLSVHTPGGDKVRWKYILADVPEGTTIDVAHQRSAPSALVLPVVSGVTGYPASLPRDCTALRAQPCRTFVEYTNTPADP